MYLRGNSIGTDDRRRRRRRNMTDDDDDDDNDDGRRTTHFKSFQRNLSAKILAFGSPHTMRLISRNTKPSCA